MISVFACRAETAVSTNPILGSGLRCASRNVTVYRYLGILDTEGCKVRAEAGCKAFENCLSIAGSAVLTTLPATPSAPNSGGSTAGCLRITKKPRSASVRA